MKSMTGYGKATVTRGNAELTIELKSVNHRFLDISTKIPRMFIAYEDVVRRVLGEGLSRGHVDVFLNYKPDDNSAKCNQTIILEEGLLYTQVSHAAPKKAAPAPAPAARPAARPAAANDDDDIIAKLAALLGD